MNGDQAEQKRLDEEEINFAQFILNSSLDALRPRLIEGIMAIETCGKDCEDMRNACIGVINKQVRHELSNVSNLKIKTETVDLTELP